MNNIFLFHGPTPRLGRRRGTGGGWREERVGPVVNPTVVPFLLTRETILSRLDPVWTRCINDTNRSVLYVVDP